MTIVEMLGQSGVLTVLGVGIVFSFLIIMIIVINLVGRIVRFLGLDKDAAAQTAPVQAAPVRAVPAFAANEAPVAAAISAAVMKYRKSNKSN